MIKQLLKPRLLIILITSISSISSCDTKEDIVPTEKLNTYRLTDQDILLASKIIKIKDAKIQSKKNGLANKTFIEAAAPEEPYIEYQDLLATQDLRIEIDSQTSHILDQTYEQNVQYLEDLNLFNSNEIAAVTVFKDELISTQNFENAILHFENTILSLPMTPKKLQRFYNFIDGLKVINNYDPYYFKGSNASSKNTGRLFGSCLSASIGVGIAFVGLATIEVGSFGAATGVAVAGFIWASAEWGAACKGGGGKMLYPEDIKKPVSRPMDIFLTFDENGDLIESPIILYFEPKPLIL